tara:strand:- start:302 stop:721 length:420 start_codon:yes stop_codon:yes gene_type:complete
MDTLYQETIMNHGHKPLNFGKPKKIEHSIEQFNPLCGDKIILYFTNDESANFMFESVSCVICKASASMMTMTINSLNLNERAPLIENIISGIKEGKIDNDNLSKDLLSLNQIVNHPSRINCALLPWQSAYDLIRKHIDE